MSRIYDGKNFQLEWKLLSEELKESKETRDYSLNNIENKNWKINSQRRWNEILMVNIIENAKRESWPNYFRNCTVLRSKSISTTFDKFRSNHSLKKGLNENERIVTLLYKKGACKFLCNYKGQRRKQFGCNRL